MKTNRTTALRIRLTEAERTTITNSAEAIGLGVCSFARMAAVKAAGLKPSNPPRQKPGVYARALAEWTTALARIGNNLNQCARIANSGGELEYTALADIHTELQKLREIVLSFDPEAPQ
jgi:hypothetical protein